MVRDALCVGWASDMCGYEFGTCQAHSSRFFNWRQNLSCPFSCIKITLYRTSLLVFQDTFWNLFLWLPSYNPWLISCCSFPLDATKQLPPIKAWTPGSLESTFSPKVVLLQALVKGKSWWWLLRRAKYYVALSGESAVIAVRAFVACPPHLPSNQLRQCPSC